jgi:hypothetical protein
MASSETIIVRRPNGYDSTPKPIQQPEPDDVQINESHRAREGGDRISNPVLPHLGTFLCVLQQARVDRSRKPVGDDELPDAVAERVAVMGWVGDGG